MSLALSAREAAVVNALKVVVHTKCVDAEFFQNCIDLAGKCSMPGFGGMLEQHEAEFQGLLSHVKGARSALEIGSRYGKSIQRIAMEMEPGARVVAVDWPMAAAVVGEPAPEAVLRDTIKGIASLGYETHLFLGNSRAPSLVAKVQELGPFDFCFIDGDHSYEGVKADWENYGQHARITAFHDIVNNVDCVRFWNELKVGRRTVEYTQSTWLGIGIVFNDKGA